MAEWLKEHGIWVHALKHLSIPAPREASIPVARELLRYVVAAGDDPEALVRRARLPHPARALLDPAWKGQLTRMEFSALYAEAAWALDARAARQEGREPLVKAEFDLFCQCLITCRTLRDVIVRATAFQTMLIPRMGRLELVEKGDVAEFHMSTFRTIRNVSAYVSDLTGLSTHHRLFSWLIGEDIRILSVGFRYPPLVSRECASRLMLHPVIHDAAENSLRFPAHYLEFPVIRTPAELDRLLERFPFDLEEILSKEAPLSEKVRVLLHSALARGEPLPTGAAIAGQFRLSPATLKRRLAEEGFTLVDLKNACRGDLARALLDDGGLAIGDVAQRVGFSDSTTFSRAFRQWTGHAPGAWRTRDVSAFCDLS
jgi:AraC-like DNA-binding protein